MDDEAKQLRDDEVKDELEHKQLLLDVQRTFDSQHGRRVFRHLMERCHVFHTTFTGNSKTFFLEGERNIGLYLLGLREMASEEGLEKLKEEAL
jgi:hypothetical protein